MISNLSKVVIGFALPSKAVLSFSSSLNACQTLSFIGKLTLSVSQAYGYVKILEKPVNIMHSNFFINCLFHSNNLFSKIKTIDIRLKFYSEIKMKRKIAKFFAREWIGSCFRVYVQIFPVCEMISWLTMHRSLLTWPHSQKLRSLLLKILTVVHFY